MLSTLAEAAVGFAVDAAGAVVAACATDAAGTAGAAALGFAAAGAGVVCADTAARPPTVAIPNASRLARNVRAAISFIMCRLLIWAPEATLGRKVISFVLTGSRRRASASRQVAAGTIRV
jgi:hypothetical protein